ncbi:uncharacterized protein LOC133530141 isoform X2 [Cydia pomonella]|uniref:uncharacterized protein LOC133530141 isoform X2 n=1 Tax=Cydia pomonella TaxID=82600 RepID=UPI002ADE345E|nr:uncharacterized protein LOC133530141 isoform X2 [Cydia pomonella]
MAEFLPLCDVLFNVISLAGYFCDVVFDVVMSYALLERGYKATFAAAISIVVTSLLITQVLSLRWYLSVWGADGRPQRPWAVAALHCLQLGVLWRYARLLAPVDTSTPRVKHQVRDLCMLRLVHAFCEAAPMLLLQLHVLLREEPEPEPLDSPGISPAGNAAFAELNVISASLSLFSVCWALASFSKNVRLRNVHRLVLTWLGVIVQFLWRLGTISARICALTAYALVYEYWVFLVIGLHWVSMFLWLISPKNVFDGERVGRARKALLAALIAAVYVLAYVNLQEHRHKQKMMAFYIVMFVENALLLVAWWWAAPRANMSVVGFSAAAYISGLACMLLYYRYFHVRRLGYMLGENQQGTNSTNASSQNKNGKQANNADNPVIPGVFNCRFTNPVNSSAALRKKKKPTSFVPPPAAPAAPAPGAPAPAPGAPAPAPGAPAPAAPGAAFWRRPLPHNHHGGSSENEGSSVGSRVNIQQKLQEKKQKQLAELRVIEEEIKQGKLAKTTPVAAEEIYSSLQRQPIPRAKTHAEPAWPSIEMTHSYQNYPVPHTCNIYPTYTEIKNYNNQPFQNNNTDLNDLKIHRRYDIYENPNISRPIHSPNYLALSENRSYETNRASPRTINNSPRNYITENNYEVSLDKSRIPNNIYSDAPEYSGFENQPYNKDEYVSNLLNQSIDARYECYGQNCDRFPYVKEEGRRKMQRCRTPEILLAPHYLEGCNREVCCHWGAPYPKEAGAAAAAAAAASSGDDSAARDAPRAPSDIDSQISLPRSYTLPREFRYWRRRPRLRDHVPSNNSSDGDVDSGDNDSDRRSNCSARQPYCAPLALDDHRRRRKPMPKPETKL